MARYHLSLHFHTYIDSYGPTCHPSRSRLSHILACPLLHQTNLKWSFLSRTSTFLDLQICFGRLLVIGQSCLGYHSPNFYTSTILQSSKTDHLSLRSYTVVGSHTFVALDLLIYRHWSGDDFDQYTSLLHHTLFSHSNLFRVDWKSKNLENSFAEILPPLNLWKRMAFEDELMPFLICIHWILYFNFWARYPATRRSFLLDHLKVFWFGA